MLEAAFWCMALIMLSKLISVIFNSVRIAMNDEITGPQKAVFTIAYFVLSVIALVIYAIPAVFLFQLFFG